jgi:hypothetical protein
MTEKVKFMELNKDERILLLRAFDYDVDDEENILDSSKNKIKSVELPNSFLKVDEALLKPGSLDVVDGTPTSISAFIRTNREQVD